MEYIEFIQNKDKNRVKAKEIENSISKLEAIKSIAKTHSKYFSKLNFVRQQIQEYLKNDNHSSIAELENKLKHFIQNISTLESRIIELENTSNFPTNEIENEIKDHIHFYYNGMDIDKINLSIEKSNSLLSKLNSERIRIQNEKQELYIKIAKYVAIAIGVGLALWIVFAIIIPFIVAYWWLILLIGGGIAYFIFKDK